jgi:hypothetical protein
MSALTVAPELAAPAAPRPPLPTQVPRPRRLALVPTQRPALTLVPALPASSHNDPTDRRVINRVENARPGAWYAYPTPDQTARLLRAAATHSPDAA